MTKQRYEKKSAEGNRELFITSVNFGDVFLYLYCSGLYNMEEKKLKGWTRICKSWTVRKHQIESSYLLLLKNNNLQCLQ